MEDMSKFFLMVSRQPSKPSEEAGTEPPLKRVKLVQESPCDTQVILRGQPTRHPKHISITRSLLRQEEYELPVEFEQIDELSSSKWPLGMMRSAPLQLQAWSQFRLHGIPSHPFELMHESTAALKVACRNLRTLGHVKRFVRHRCTLLESYRQTRPLFFEFPIPRSSWGSEMPEVARVVAGALAVRPLSEAALSGADLIRKTSCPPDMIARCLDILQGMGLVRLVAGEYSSGSRMLLDRRYTWQTESEVVWMDLSFFISLLLTLRQQRALLQRCVTQALHQLQLPPDSEH